MSDQVKCPCCGTKVVAGQIIRLAPGEKAVFIPEHNLDWRRVAAQLEARSGVMAAENASLTTAQRNTPFGVMTGTTTLVLGFLAEAIGVGLGDKPDEELLKNIDKLRVDRAESVLTALGLKIDRAVKPPPAKDD